MRPSNLLFNETFYLNANPDVRTAVQSGAFTSGQQHFTLFGQAEGRNASPYFNVAVYRSSNPDLEAAGLTTDAQLTRHFYEFGNREPRNFLNANVFDPVTYAARNPDLATAGITEPGALAAHFRDFGISEGRAASGRFDPATYAAANTDLARAGITTDAALRTHYYTFGQFEGRPGTLAAQSFELTTTTSTVAEGSGLQFTVVANYATTTDRSFTYTIAGDTNNGTVEAATSADFAVASGTVVIPAGATSIAFTVTPTVDASVEALEGFRVRLLDSNTLVQVATRTAIITDNSQNQPQTLSLTTSGDALVGGGGNDTVNGVVAGNNESGTTLQAGDVVNGGAGTDTLAISVSGSAANAGTSATAFTLTGVERVLVSNFQTNTTQVTNDPNGVTWSNRFDMSLADSGLTTVGLSASSANGDTRFIGLTKLVNAEMSNGSADLSLAFSAGASGTADAIALRASNASGTFTADAIETINLTSATAANTLTVNGAQLTRINVDGSAALTLTQAATVTTVNAATFTGALTMTAGAAVAYSVAGGAGNDVITVTTSNLTSADTITGGTGNDTLKIDAPVSTANATNVSGFEVIEATTNNAAAYDLSALTGKNTVTRLVASAAAAADQITFSNVTAAVTNIDVTGTEGVIATLATNTAADATTVTFNGVTVTGQTTLNDYETLTVVAGGSAASNTGNFTATSLTTLNVQGSRDLTLGTMQTGTEKITSINASTMTGALIMSNNLGTSASTIQGGSANDTLIGGSAADSIVGNAGNDSIQGAAGNDTIVGGAGVDTITGGAGTDSLSGGEGNDIFVVTTSAELIGLTNVETIDGGAGTDTLQFAAGSFTVAAADLLGLRAVETVQFLSVSDATSITLTDAVFTANATTSLTLDYGTATTADTAVSAGGLTAANSVTVIRNNAGADLAGDNIVLGAGNDTVTINAAGLDDAATVNGGGGTDTLRIAATGSATINAGFTNFERMEFTTATADYTVTTVDANISNSGTFTVDGSTLTTGKLSFTTASGETGRVSITGGAANDTLVGGSGNDTITGNDGVDSITGGAGVDSLSGGNGDDTFVVTATAEFLGLVAPETVLGGAGNDTLSFTGNDARTINATDLLGLNSVETISIGGNAANTITLTDQVFTANGVTNLRVTDADGSAGALTVTAGSLSAGNSVTVTGNTATGVNDTLNGGAGNDTFIFSTTTGLEATDTVNGGSGTDTIQLNVTAAATAVLNGVTNVERIVTSGTGHNVSITLGANTVINANSTLLIDTSSNANNLTLDASAGTTTSRNVSVVAGNGTDSIIGTSGNDTVSGGQGNDTIRGGDGADVISGGTGTDTFVYTGVSQSSGTTIDDITDWVSGTDKLQVDLNYSSSVASVVVNTQILTAASGLTAAQNALSGERGQVIYDTASSTLYINNNNDNLLTSLDYAIKLAPAGTAANTVVAGDILFSVVGGSGADTITIGHNAAHTINGGAGADSITLTTSTVRDTVIMAAGGTSVSIGGTGNNGTISGYDTITGFNVGTTAASKDLLDVVGTVAANAAGTNGTDSTLTVSAAAIASHAITDGIITFDDNNTYDAGSLVSVTTEASLAAVVQYLTLNDLGNGGTSVGFTANIGSARTFVYTQTGDNAGGTGGYTLVELVGVTAVSLITDGTSTTANALLVG
ncbi:MAG: hypothetical protein RLY86_2233 [Pseudomonadota bacterium]|jgi:Ca2+-binding RTX toxin-like protein